MRNEVRRFFRFRGIANAFPSLFIKRNPPSSSAPPLSLFSTLSSPSSSSPSTTSFSSSSSPSLQAAMGSNVEWPAKRVRDTFISFFEEKNHVFYKSSPVVPHNDPTLLFANAGMNQFKPIFLGQVDPNTALSKLTRACNTQKCIRAGGKHNDLDDVGKDTYHHTFFEMLGNWSFGDYFKKEAIGWAWELLTKASASALLSTYSLKSNLVLMGKRIKIERKTILTISSVYKLPTDRIFATYFGGDEKAGLAPDNEARDIWLQFLPPGHVLPFGCKIHYDRIGNRDAASLVNNDDPTCIEIWNLVFIQYNRESDGSLSFMPAKHVDTGMGFERLTSVLQNKMSNYNTDVTGARPFTGKVGSDDVDKVDMAYRVVADHIRTLSFAIADGSCPGNEGREYVLRRILRRAVVLKFVVEESKSSLEFYGVNFILVIWLVDIVVKVMSDVFPELKQHEGRIRDIIADEEASFGKTLLKNLKDSEVVASLLINSWSAFSLVDIAILATSVDRWYPVDEMGEGIEKFKKAAQDVEGKILSGQDAFVLWDTYGFPLDLTQLMAEERGLQVDVEGFNNAMDEARERSRNAQNKQSGGAIVMNADATAELHQRGIAATDDSFKFTCAYAGGEVGIVLESTSFYAEQGGQIFDTGALEGPFGLFQVINVQIYGGFILHIGHFAGKSGRLSVDYKRRKLIAPNHTCTHMLNFALREVLGNHVDQKGSIVLPEKLRFDFSHGKPVDVNDLRRIETIVNEQIKAELDVFGKEATLADAKRINGLRAVFGEVYPDPVRVVAIGRKVEELLSDPENDEEAKAFVLLSEEGIAKGIRRITAVTTDMAYEAEQLAYSLEKEVDDASKEEGSSLEKKVASLKSRVDSAQIPAAKKDDIRTKINQLQKQVKIAHKKIAEQNLKKAIEVTTMFAEIAVSEGKAFCICNVDVGLDASAVREAVSQVIRDKGISAMVFSTDETTNKAVVCAGVPETGVERQLDVTDWLTAALEPLNGRCGRGRGGLATGQGTNASQVQEAMTLAASFALVKLE
ncbi:Alanine-tRNA ligase, class IIc [Trema orientale]|uniref:Alanine--tRNA ligase n=1 Tax=Trema orientale TaxID=63057 RepID=A0A2P5CS02_TREOI|nr:Alanine-tRNA ligase, class IIc [Trema orientale]